MQCPWRKHNRCAPKRSSAKRGRCRAKSPAATSAPTKLRRIGRQAPVKRCLARFAGLASRDSNGRARYIVPLRRKSAGVQINGTRKKIVTALAVGKHLLDTGYVCFVDQRELFQLAHAAGPFCAHQV